MPAELTMGAGVGGGRHARRARESEKVSRIDERRPVPRLDVAGRDENCWVRDAAAVKGDHALYAPGPGLWSASRGTGDARRGDELPCDERIVDDGRSTYRFGEVGRVS